MFGSEKVWEVLASTKTVSFEEIPDITCARKAPLSRIGQQRDCKSRARSQQPAHRKGGGYRSVLLA